MQHLLCVMAFHSAENKIFFFHNKLRVQLNPRVRLWSLSFCESSTHFDNFTSVVFVLHFNIPSNMSQIHSNETRRVLNLNINLVRRFRHSLCLQRGLWLCWVAAGHQIKSFDQQHLPRATGEVSVQQMCCRNKRSISICTRMPREHANRSSLRGILVSISRIHSGSL